MVYGSDNGSGTKGGEKRRRFTNKEQYTAANNDRTIMHNPPTVEDNYNTVFDSQKEKNKMNKKARRKKTIQSTIVTLITDTGKNIEHSIFISKFLVELKNL